MNQIFGTDSSQKGFPQLKCTQLMTKLGLSLLVLEVSHNTVIGNTGKQMPGCQVAALPPNPIHRHPNLGAL